MKITILGAPKLVDGKIEVSRVNRYNTSFGSMPISKFHFSPPSGGWESVLDSTEPYRIKSASGKGSAYWLCRGKIVHLSDAGHLTEEEQKLEVAHAVLRHEKRYRQLQRQLDAFDRLERSDFSGREPIPDQVRLFVWQRDQGKCVKCG